MLLKDSASADAQTLLTGIAMGESPRWHNGRLWFSDWEAREVVAVGANGNREVIVQTTFDLPFCIDWLPDGRLLIVSGREGLLLRRESNGRLVTHADLRHLDVLQKILSGNLRRPPAVGRSSTRAVAAPSGRATPLPRPPAIFFVGKRAVQGRGEEIMNCEW